MINTYSPGLDEILAEVNAATDPKRALVEALSKYSYMREYILAAVDDVFCSLDKGEIKFKIYDYHRSMSGAILLNRRTWSIVETVLLSPRTSKHTKQVQYKALKEMLYNGESVLLDAILDKNLPALYPNLSFELLNEAINETTVQD